MLDIDAAASTTKHEATGFRDRLPTLPFDLSEYARVQTGPASWSARVDDGALEAWASDDDGVASRTTALLAAIGPTDVPRVVAAPSGTAQHVSHREAFVIASVDGQSNVDALVDLVDLPAGEVLAIVCSLAARGILAVDAAPR